ncbi:MAG: NCS2 family permease, partial [Gemmatimonadota bacterium]|nr:NCS2 family permease [Gemmatimonadota bacterium]
IILRRQDIWQKVFSAGANWEALKVGDWTFPFQVFKVYGIFPAWGGIQLVAMAGLALCLVLLIKKVRGALLLGMLGATAIAIAAGMVHWKGLVSAPPSMEPTLFKFSFSGLFTWKLFPLVLVFLFMDFFDTIGTLIGVTEQAKLVDESGRLPRARQALLADAIGTTVGAALGTSTVTSYIESTAGVQAGGRTGLTAVFCAMLFLLAVFFCPLIQMVGSGVASIDGIILYPITSAALIIVGVIMIRGLGRLSFKRWEKIVPAMLIVVGMPLSYSIADGLAFGFITWPLFHRVSGKGKEVSWLLYVLGIIFLLRYIFL